MTAPAFLIILSFWVFKVPNWFWIHFEETQALQLHLFANRKPCHFLLPKERVVRKLVRWDEKKKRKDSFFFSSLTCHFANFFVGWYVVWVVLMPVHLAGVHGTKKTKTFLECCKFVSLGFVLSKSRWFYYYSN